MSEHPFEIVTEHGDRAEADDEAGALCAARELRRDHLNGVKGKRPVVHILHEGECVLTLAPEMKP